MSNPVKCRSEILFMYDVKDANPNGDPLDENKPRIDEETGINLVTDVRLKRTIRDYLYKYRNHEIFVREIENSEGHIQDAKLRAEDFLIKEGKTLDKSKLKLMEMKSIIDTNILDQCIDVRLFGVTLPVEKDKTHKSSITHTGPVQFKIGRSLHKVFMKHFKGTGAFASGKEAEQKTFREEDFLPYSLICFYGIINENVANETKLTDDDVNALLDGMWNGTKNLISRSKAGQVPRLLIKVNYQESNFHIGDLNNMVKRISDIPDAEIRDISELKIDITDFVDTLKKHLKQIKNIEYKIDPRLIAIYNKNTVPVDNCLKDAGFTLIPITI